MKKLYSLSITIIIAICLYIILSGSKNLNHNNTSNHYLENEWDDVLFSCSYTNSVGEDDCIPDNFGSFTTNNLSIAIVLKKIMQALAADSSIHISANFLTYECNFPQPVFKALTKKSDTSRYILYTKRQLDQLTAINTDWVAYSIFAHEVGHHLYGHSLSAPKDFVDSRQREIEADFFSGFVLHKLGATLNQAESGIKAFDNHPSNELEEWSTHPTKIKRLKSVNRGFNFVDAPSASTRTLLNIDSLRIEKTFEQIFNKSLFYFNEGNFNKAFELLIDLEAFKNNESKANYYNNRGFIKRQIGDLEGAIKEFDKAIQIDNSKFEFFLNRAEAKEKTSIKVLEAESKEDLKQARELEIMQRVRGF